MPLPHEFRRVVLEVHEFFRYTEFFDAVSHPHINDTRIHTRAKNVRRLVVRIFSLVRFNDRLLYQLVVVVHTGIHVGDSRRIRGL